MKKARSFAAREKFSFPVVFATPDVAGVYNIIYRYLFDRRRDLAIPTSFLVDKEGMIVKVYQGPLDGQRLLEDVRSAPTTAAALRVPPAQRLIHHGNDGFVVQYLVGMNHPVLTQVADFFGDPVIAELQLRASHINHGASSQASAKLDPGAVARD